MLKHLLTNLKKKFLFHKPKKKKYLIIEKSESDILLNLLGKKNTETIFLNNEINIYLVFILLLKLKKFNQINYYKEAIKTVKPNFIITAIDTNPNFYKLKKYYPKKIFISIQNGVRFDSIFKKEKNLKCDIIFCQNINLINFFKKRVNSKVIILGKLRNNNISNDTIKENNCLSYISQFRDRNENINNINFFGKYNKLTWGEYIQSEKKLVILLNNFCKKNKIKFNIVGATFNSSLEKKWYVNLMKSDKINFISRKETNSSYNFLKKSKYIACIDSTLGFEFLSRDKKVIFFSRNTKIKSFDEEIKFGGPTIVKNKGFFYTNEINKKEVKRLMNNITSCNKKNWKKKINLYKKHVMFYNKGNTIFKNKIRELETSIN